MARKKHINAIYTFVENELGDMLESGLTLSAGQNSYFVESEYRMITICFEYSIGTDEDYNLKLQSVDVTYIGYEGIGQIMDSTLQKKIEKEIFNQINDKI